MLKIVLVQRGKLVFQQIAKLKNLPTFINWVSTLDVQLFLKMQTCYHWACIPARQQIVQSWAVCPPGLELVKPSLTHGIAKDPKVGIATQLISNGSISQTPNFLSP